MKNEKIKVSIIIPIYNVEKYLNKCLDSIINQTHRNIEIILVDDGSTDNSGIIADEYAQRDIRIIVIHKMNAKVSAARNSGINVATGEYICFVDADDYLMPDYVEYLLDLAVGYNADISLTTEMFTTFHTKQTNKETICVKTPEEATVDILTYNMPIGVYCKMFRRDFLDQDIRFVEHIYIGEGFNFNTMAFQRAEKVVEGNRKVYFYRRDNPTSATTKFKLEKWENAIYAIENIYNNLIIKTKRIEVAWNYANWHTHCDAFNFLVMAKEDRIFSEKYKEWNRIVRTKAWYSFRVQISFREKVRGIIMMFCPRFMPWIINKRNKRYRKGS